jgi:hypothetical protein
MLDLDADQKRFLRRPHKQMLVFGLIFVRIALGSQQLLSLHTYCELSNIYFSDRYRLIEILLSITPVNLLLSNLFDKRPPTLVCNILIVF